uniref:trypsin n=1 Tax=Clastoptera arizonana TaxID=38151 RepID=A0A1B6C9S6_9HEMI
MDSLAICLIICLYGGVLSTPINILHSRNVQHKNNKIGIIGGDSASIKQFPYQAALLSDNELFGGGIILGKKFILTSAFVIAPYTSIVVQVGSASSKTGGTLIKVEKSIVHEDFYGYSYDVALLKLAKPIKYGKTAKPIRMASKEAKNATSAVVSGYGFSSNHDLTDDNGFLTKGTQTTIDKSSCQAYYSYITLDETNSCAFNNTLCNCYSDIGNPLVQNSKLLGYFLGGNWCCNGGTPQIYSNIPAVRKWVLKHMKTEGFRSKENLRHYYKVKI